MTKIPVSGGVGTPPPPGAPYEVTTEGSERPTEEQIALAQQNERSLQPLVFETRMPPAAGQPAAAHPAPAVSALDATTGGGRRIRQVKRPSAEGGESVAAGANGTDAAGRIVLTDAHVAATHVPTSVDVARGAVDAPRDAPYQPAASDSESPSRGVPRRITDPGKVITGGFGDTGEAQYFPLDGSELRELIYALMDDLHQRCQDDLRFMMAICYPRVTARVIIEVQAHVADQSFDIIKVMPPHTKTPLEVAREHGDEVAFVLVAERVEMTAAGDSVSPPNQTRQELGLVIPRKHAVETPTGRQLVDIPTP